MLLLLSCKENSNDPEEKSKLYVKFINESALFTITDLQIQQMGPAGGEGTPSGDWSGNILTDTLGVAPGDSTTFYVNIPSGNFARYRLSVKEGNGPKTVLHEQAGYADASLEPTITHWGHDTRTVSCTIVRNSNGIIIINGWSDFAGM